MPRIMIVDDEADLCELYRVVFQSQGYDVRTASHGAEATRIVEEWQPDLVLLDVKLRQESGLDLLRRFRKLRPRMLVVLFSAYPDYTDEFASWLADDCLVKSAELETITGKVRELLVRSADAACSDSRSASNR